MERRMITIRGRILYPESFISTLDVFPFSLDGCRADKRDEYFNMRRLIQIMADNYSEGLDEIGPDNESLFETYSYPLPKERKLPQAFEEIFSTMERKLGIDLTPELDRCVKYSMKALEREEEKERKEKERVELVHKLLSENGIGEERSESAVERIQNLIALEKAKRECPDYRRDETEEAVTRLWCHILLTSLMSDYLECGEMESLVSYDIVTEHEFTDLLQNRYSMDEDWECYSEDFFSSTPDEETVIRISDVLEIGEKRVAAVLGAEI